MANRLELRPKRQKIIGPDTHVRPDLVTLHRAIKHLPEELYRQYKYRLVSRSEFEREQMVNPETLTDIQRAARYPICRRASAAISPAAPSTPPPPASPALIS